MDESELVACLLWFGVTGIIMLITGFSSNAYSKKRTSA